MAWEKIGRKDYEEHVSELAEAFLAKKERDRAVWLLDACRESRWSTCPRSAMRGITHSAHTTAAFRSCEGVLDGCSSYEEVMARLMASALWMDVWSKAKERGGK